ncbi:leishmanolysin-related zinc metalloendopeptidase, partial [Salmonella sp. s51228]|uniref:leishmanolysin-related zinc metalloendopeptidase n=1 Tax=Salmonella sp. s51228 TaxID=3159652 RepID=UPI00397FC32B
FQSHASSDPFCFNFDNDLLICNDDYSGVGSCGIAQYISALPIDFQYFNSDPGLGISSNFDRIGGSFQAPDFCPVVSSFSNKVCSSSSPPTNNVDLQSYGTDSRCFTKPSPWQK